MKLKALAVHRLCQIALAAVTVLFTISSPVQSQSDRPTLSVGWVHAPPLSQKNEDGEEAGFFIEFAQLIADELDHELVLIEYQTVVAALRAQNAGETDMMAGTAAFDVFKENNLFSIPVGRTQNRIFTHADSTRDWDANAVSDTIVGYAPATLSPEVSAFLERNFAVGFSSLSSGVMGVLSGDFEAFIYPEETASYLLHRSRIDHLVVPVGEPLNVLDRVVVLHRSRADLLDPINAAIERMKADGTLTALLAENRVEIYEPAPEVLTVAFPDLDAVAENASGFAPSYMLNEAGEPGGYAIEIFRDVADRAGLKYKFKRVPAELMVQGPTVAGVDIIPSLGISARRTQIMDQTLPAGNLEILATIRQEDADRILTPADLSGATVGALVGSFSDIQARRDPTLNVKTYARPGALLDALLDGSVDAAFMLRTHLQKLADKRGVGAKVVELEEVVFSADRAISLRFGLGQVRESLNEELPSYLLSAEFFELREAYYGTPVFWSETRLRYLTVILGGLGILVFGLLIAFLSSERARRREKDANQEAETARREAVDLSIRLQAVMEASSNGVVVLSRDGQIAMMNPRARDLLDTPENLNWPEGGGVSYFAINEAGIPLVGEDCPFRIALKNNNIDGKLYQFHLKGSKKPKHIRVSSSAIPLDASSEIGTVIILNDVTEYERQRKESLRNGRMSAIGRLTGGVAHDFNNLLAIIMGNLELMRDTEADPVHSEMIEAGLAATRRGANLTKNLLAFSRQSRLEVEVLDLNSVVLDAQNWMRRALPESIIVETSLFGGVWPVELDRSSLESALLNLIVNARDAMDGIGRLTIETANLCINEAIIDTRDEELAAGGYVMLAVTDTGAGISQENLERLFEPFFTTKGPGGGSGVGLSMVQGFVQQSGGAVQVYSEQGVGTTFKLYFPATKGGIRSGSDEEPKTAVTKEGIARILLAEDDKSVRKVLEEFLKGAGYTVVSAGSGDAALELFHSEPKFDLLVTDIVMPGALQGTGLAKAIRPLQPNLPIIFLSGYAAEANVHGNGLLPEDVRLMKPVPKQELLDAVARQLENTKS